MPTWLPRHTYILLPSHPNFSHPHGPVGRRGRKATSLTGQEGQGRKAHSSQSNRPSWNFGSEHSVQPLSGTRSVFFELVLAFWSCCSGYHLQGCQPIMPWDTPPAGQKLMMSLFAQPTASHATTSPNCSDTLRTSYNEMLNRSKLERQLDFAC